MAQKLIKPKKVSKSSHANSRGLAAVVEKVESKMIRSDFPQFKAGDTVRVHVKIKEGDKERVQPYEGLVIARSNRGSNKSFTVRKISHGVGVERVFVESSPKIAKLELVTSGAIRRAKLYYIRGKEGKAARIDREQATAQETVAK